MKLTTKRKLSIVEKFKKGESMAVIADWNEQPIKRIEGVIREFMNVTDKLEKKEVASAT